MPRRGRVSNDQQAQKDTQPVVSSVQQDPTSFCVEYELSKINIPILLKELIYMHRKKEAIIQILGLSNSINP